MIRIPGLIFFLFCTCIALYVVNYSLFLSLRLFDLFYLFTIIIFLFTDPKLDKNILLIIIALILIHVISSIKGLMLDRKLQLTHLIFMYKYFVIITIPWLVTSILNTSSRILIANRLLFYSFMLTCVWVYAYLFLLKINIIAGSFRPSFPVSNDYGASDAHLLSSYLGFMLMAYVIYIRRVLGHGFIKVGFCIIVGFPSLMLTGSRSGLLLVLIALLAFALSYFMVLLKKTPCVSPVKLLAFIIFIILMGFIVFIFKDVFFSYINNYIKLLERAFNFDLVNDQSSIGRVVKLEIALSDLTSFGIGVFGVGVFSSLVWYDGLLSILIAQGGILFVLMVVFLCFYICANVYNFAKLKQRSSTFYSFMLLFSLYIIVNLITEYIFISRSAFPCLTLLSIIYCDIRVKEKL